MFLFFSLFLSLFVCVCVCFPMIPHRLKRDSTKLNSADMLALLSFLEAQQRNRYDNGNGNDDINALEYPKSLYGPYGNFDAVDNDDDIVDGGEWWNEYIEPSVQYYGGGNGRGNGRFDENPRKRLTSTGIIHIVCYFIYSPSLSLYFTQWVC